MTTPKNGRGSFDYDGEEAYYYVTWRIDDDDLEVKVYLDPALKLEVTNHVYDFFLIKLENMAIDDYHGNL